MPSTHAKPVVAVRNALRMLRAFSYEDPVLGVSELARRLVMPKSTVSRLAQTLAAEGFITAVPGGYRLALRLHELGSLVVSGLELRELAHGKLVQLRNVTGETVHLAVLDGTEVVYVDRIESPNTLHFFTRLGKRMPAHCTSSGKAILAFEHPAAIETVLKAGLAPLTERTLCDRDALLRALEVTRANGFAASVEESELGLSSVAAPIFDYTTKVVAAISVAGPSHRITATVMARIAAHLKEATADVSHELGYRPRARTFVAQTPAPPRARNATVPSARGRTSAANAASTVAR